MSTARREWFRQRLTVTWVVAIWLGTPWAWIGYLILRGLGVRWLFLAWAMLFTMGMALRERRGIHLHEDGLTLVGWFSRRHVPWSRIGDLRHENVSASFTADGERVVLDERTVDWRLLFNAIERHVRPDAAAEDGAGEMDPAGGR